ncbi:MAG: FAD-dependent oxidoreductase, partial [Gammaproteobacteria bacterium]|nr:FAD-dependent oxidoreductase [Gammaproteobacteria bacterium]
MENHSTIIIGGGWAGLAAAVELSKHNIPVTVFEAAKQAGGRARTVTHNNTLLDNGQHLMIGAYHQMLSLLKTININYRDVFLQIPQQLEIIDLNRQTTVFKLKLPLLPAPINLLTGILSCPSLNLTSKLKTLYKFNKLLKTPLNKDISVEEWLNTAGLPAEYTNYLLKPLCLAALTTHPHEASARIFQTVLQQTFNGQASNTDLLIPA